MIRRAGDISDPLALNHPRHPNVHMLPPKKHLVVLLISFYVTYVIYLSY